MLGVYTLSARGRRARPGFSTRSRPTRHCSRTRSWRRWGLGTRPRQAAKAMRRLRSILEEGRGRGRAPDGGWEITRLRRRVRRLLGIVLMLALAVGAGGDAARRATPRAPRTTASTSRRGRSPTSCRSHASSTSTRPRTRSTCRGLPAGAPATLSPTQLWYGVFLWAKNQSRQPQTTSDNFDIVDTEGNHYYPVDAQPLGQPYAWKAQRLAPERDRAGSRHAAPASAPPRVACCCSSSAPRCTTTGR